MSILDEHLKMQELVKAGVIVPGYTVLEEGVRKFEPLSLGAYKLFMENGKIENLAYNTYSMGRGIFTVSGDGKIINTKGVDSRLPDEKNIAYQTTDCTVEDISEAIGVFELPHRITCVHFAHQAPEIRVRGSAQFQNLLIEKKKLDEMRAKDTKHELKLPEITSVTAFSDMFCATHGLPRKKLMDRDFIELLKQRQADSLGSTSGLRGDYGFICLSYLKGSGLNNGEIKFRSEYWSEWYSRLLPEQQEKISEDTIKVLESEDQTYELGAMFGQAERVLETPFRIMDLAYFASRGEKEKVAAIVNFESSVRDEDFLSYYAKTMGKNAAGLLNIGYATNNFLHRQDYALSGELCDDTYEDVSGYMEKAKMLPPLKEGEEPTEEHYRLWSAHNDYYGQVFLMASNMKVIEDSYRLMGKEVPENYQDLFIDELLGNLNNKNMNMRALYNFKNPIKLICREDEEKKQNFAGYEDYIDAFKQRLDEKMLQMVKRQEATGKSTHEDDDDYIP